MEPLQSGGMSHPTMYVGRYSVAGKRLHHLAIKARGKKQSEKRTRGGEKKQGDRGKERKGERTVRNKRQRET